VNGLFESSSGPQSAGSSDPDPGVLGRLPRTRPTKRSPRREDAAVREARQAKMATPPEPTRDERAAPPRAAPEPERGALEDVARAGVGLAVGAVELGFRVAGGALGAIRNAGRR
jgi:hypothetical protein